MLDLLKLFGMIFIFILGVGVCGVTALIAIKAFALVWLSPLKAKPQNEDDKLPEEQEENNGV